MVIKREGDDVKKISVVTVTVTPKTYVQILKGSQEIKKMGS